MTGRVDGESKDYEDGGACRDKCRAKIRFCRPATGGSPATPTRHLFIANCGPKVGISANAVAESLACICGCAPHDVLVTEPETAESSAYVFVTFPSADLAVQAKKSLENPEGNQFKRNMVVEFADAKPEKDFNDSKSCDHFAAMEEEAVLLSTEESCIAGLSLWEGFISIEEEAKLLDELYQQSWDQLSKRRVQHYGKVFRYDIRAVDADDNSIATPPFLKDILIKAAELDEVKAHFKDEGVDEPLFDQVTVNEYLRGVGLSTHVDTHSAFIGPILSLTLAGHTVMKFRVGGIPTGVHGLEMIDDLKSTAKPPAGSGEEALLLSRRSLLIMAKEARYEWAHYIPPRKTDVISGGRVDRPESRVSITMRRLRRPQICRCRFQRYIFSPSDNDSYGRYTPQRNRLSSLALNRQCDSFWRDKSESLALQNIQQDQGEQLDKCALEAPLVLEASEPDAQAQEDAKSTKKQLRKSKREQKRQLIQRQESELRKQCELDSRHNIATAVAKAKALLNEAGSQDGLPNTENNVVLLPEVERVFVREVYEHIAPHFSSTRYARWPKVVEFLQSLQPGALVADVGCGNGKYLGVRQDCYLLGSDSSINLLKICRAKGFDTAVADTVTLPYRSNVCDAAISIAVLHHLSTPLRRLRMIRELLRVSRPGGRVLITAWAEEQNGEDQKRATKWHSIEKDEGSGDVTNDTDFLVPWNFPLHRAGANQREWMANRDRENAKGSETTNFVQLDQGKGTLVYNRYYHVFRQGELEKLCQNIENATIESCFYDKSNWCIILVKR